MTMEAKHYLVGDTIEYQEGYSKGKRYRVMRIEDSGKTGYGSQKLWNVDCLWMDPKEVALVARGGKTVKSIIENTGSFQIEFTDGSFDYFNTILQKWKGPSGWTNAEYVRDFPKNWEYLYQAEEVTVPKYTRENPFVAPCNNMRYYRDDEGTIRVVGYPDFVATAPTAIKHFQSAEKAGAPKEVVDLDARLAQIKAAHSFCSTFDRQVERAKTIIKDGDLKEVLRLIAKEQGYPDLIKELDAPARKFKWPKGTTVREKSTKSIMHTTKDYYEGDAKVQTAYWLADIDKVERVEITVVD